MEAAAKNSEKKIRAAGKIWRDEETMKLLELMKGGEEGLGFYGRMKVKKLERNRAISAIAANLSADNLAVTSQQVNNKWKSLLARYRVVEDHNRQSGNNRMDPAPFHEEISDIVGARASSKLVSLAGTGVLLSVPARLPSVSLSASLSSSVSAASSNSLPPSSRSVVACSSTQASESPAGMSFGTPSPATNFKMPWPLHEDNEDYDDGDDDNDHAKEQEDRAAGAGAVDVHDVSDEDGAGFGIAAAAAAVAEPPAKMAKKADKKAKSKSRSSEIMSWAEKYQERQEKSEKAKMELSKEQHTEKMQLLSRLADNLQK